MTHPHEHYMRLALREAARGARAGEVPIGALLVDADGEVISRAYNRPVCRVRPDRPRRDRRAAARGPAARQLSAPRHDALRHPRAVRDVRRGAGARARRPRGLRRDGPEGGRRPDALPHPRRPAAEPPGRGRRRGARGGEPRRCCRNSSRPTRPGGERQASASSTPWLASCRGGVTRPASATLIDPADCVRRSPPGILASGEVAEWPKAPLSKSGSALKVLVGSNPTLSATAAVALSRCRSSSSISLRFRPTIQLFSQAERCPSGRRSTSGKRVGGHKLPRGFKSHSLRHGRLTRADIGRRGRGWSGPARREPVNPVRSGRKQR